MEKPIMMKPEVFEALKQIQQKNISGNLYNVVWKNEKAFGDVGISLEELTDLLDMKQNAEDYPNPEFYQVYDQWRASYIHEHLADPEVKLYGDNERSFMAAVRNCDSWRIDYEQKAEELSNTVTNAFKELKLQQKNLEREGLSSLRGALFQIVKRFEKVRGFFLRENEIEGIELSDPKIERKEKNDYEAREPEKGALPIIEQIAMPELEDTVDRRVMADNYKLWSLTDEQKMASDQATVLYRIQANKDINNVFGVDVIKGELGGWIENEKNLEGNSWVGDNAEVFGRAKVVNSVVMENAIVRDDANIINDSCVTGNVLITGSTVVDNSIVTDNAQISDFAVVTNTAVDGYSSISGASRVYDSTCSINTHIVDSQIENVDMAGDIYIEGADYGYGDRSGERDYVDYIPPALLNVDLLKKLRAHQESGLKNEVVCSDKGLEFIADLALVRGKYLSMELSANHPVIRYDGKCYDGQKILDKLKELHYPIGDVRPEYLMGMMDGKPQQLGEYICAIRQVGEGFIMEDVTESVAETMDNLHEKDILDEPSLNKEDELKEKMFNEEEQDKEAKQEVRTEIYPADIRLKSLFAFSGEEKVASDQVTILHRIQANRDLSFINEKDVPEGTLGGWIESEKNLIGYSWVGDNAEVYGQARVTNSVILGNSIVKDEAVVKESTIWGNSQVIDAAEVEESLISGYVRIADSAFIEKTVFTGYGSVSGDSHLDNCLCRKNVNVIDSWLRNVNMEGDFLLRTEKLDYKTEKNELEFFGYTPPALLVDSILDKLRSCPEGVKEATLCEVEDKKLIADLNFVEGEDMRMKLDVSNLAIQCKGINYNGQKIMDGLMKLHRDIAGIHPDRLMRMMMGEPLHVRSVLYAIQQKGDEYELADLRKRVKNIQIYSLNGGGMSIRCTIDGIQQGGKRLSADTLRAFNDKTDRRALAVDYFMNELQGNRRMEHSMKR